MSRRYTRFHQDLSASYLPNSSLNLTSFIKVNFDKSVADLIFDKPQFGVSTGQAAVFYNVIESSHVLGGGWITKAPNNLADVKLHSA